MNRAEIRSFMLQAPVVFSDTRTGAPLTATQVRRQLELQTTVYNTADAAQSAAYQQLEERRHQRRRLRQMNCIQP